MKIPKKQSTISFENSILTEIERLIKATGKNRSVIVNQLISEALLTRKQSGDVTENPLLTEVKVLIQQESLEIKKTINNLGRMAKIVNRNAKDTYVTRYMLMNLMRSFLHVSGQEEMVKEVGVAADRLWHKSREIFKNTGKDDV